MYSANQNEKEKIKSELLGEYLNFIREHQSVSDASVYIRKKYVAPFLSEISTVASTTKLKELSTKSVHDYVIKTTRPLKRTVKKHVVSSMRSFLRFAHIKGYISKNFAEAVPIITTRKLEVELHITNCQE